MTPLTQELDAFRQKASQMTEYIDGVSYLSKEWIRSHEWAITPIQRWPVMSAKNKQVHLREDQIEWLVEATRRLGCNVGLAIPIESSRAGDGYYRVELTWDDLFEFSTKCADTDYLLTSEDTYFAVLCSAVGYSIIAGPVVFVRAAVRDNIYDIREGFQRYANNPYGSLPQESVKPLTLVAERYRHIHDLIGYSTVIDSDLKQRFGTLGREMIEGEEMFDLGWLRSKNWAAVPVSKLGYRPDLLAEAFSAMGHQEVFAFRMFNDECYRIPTIAEGTTSFDNMHNFLNFLMFPEDRSCAMLNVNEFYNIIAGPRGFVVKALGMSIPTARKLFVNRYAMLESKGGEEYMLETAQRYNEFNGE